MIYTSARRNMVENQIRANRVHDSRLIAAFADIPREVFVAKSHKPIAYLDECIPLGGSGRFIMEPMLTARLMQAAAITPLDVVLEIGGASGYTAALLARLASTVVALECDPDLAATAQEALTALEIDTVSVVQGALADGYPQQAPYDVIFFNGAIAAVPDSISAQLAEDGRLLAVLDPGRPGNGPGNAPGYGFGKAILMSRRDGILSSRELFECTTPTLPGFAPSPSFVF